MAKRNKNCPYCGQELRSDGSCRECWWSEKEAEKTIKVAPKPQPSQFKEWSDLIMGK